MLWFLLFIFGLAIGSFVNVVATRYDGEHFLVSNKLIGGRSHCDACGQTLRWFELLPLVSFCMQRGKCRNCNVTLSIQYPIIEMISGLIFVFVPLEVGITHILAAAFWIVVFESLLVMSLIDIRMGIIPDELSFFLGILGIVIAMNNSGVSRLIGALAAGIFFGFLILITKGKGMGMGDLKLVIPLGLLFAWPMIALVCMFGFIIGAVFGLASIAFRKNTMKGTVPFGPFLAIGSVIVFFWGASLIGWYLALLGF